MDENKTIITVINNNPISINKYVLPFSIDEKVKL